MLHILQKSEWLTTDYNSSASWSALCFQYLDCLEELTTVEGLWKQQASNDRNDGHRSIDRRRIPNRRNRLILTVSTCFQFLSSSL
jgi:hypothetical protein